MASIRFISTSAARAATHNKESTDRIELTPWDLRLLLIDPIQKGLLFHKPKPEITFNLVNHLRNSLSRTLDFFPPLAGRLAIVEHADDNTTSFFINCNNEGAEFVHAIADGVSIADIIQPVYIPEIVHSFFPQNEVSSLDGVSRPLLAVQVTQLADGIFIGCTMNHTVADGSSFWHFFNSWSEISRGFDCISKPPVFQRGLFTVDYPIHIPFSSSELKKLNNRFTRRPYQQKMLHFTKENIAKLKAKANSEIGSCTNEISSLQAVLSHVWRSIIHTRCLNQRLVDPDQEVRYVLVMGARPRLNPPLAQEYFGNALQGGAITMKAREVLEQGLGSVAMEMNKMVALHTDEKLRNFLESWIEKPELVRMYRSSNALITSSSPRFNVYGNDFGWGSPIAVRSGPGNKSDGKITLFPGAEQGSIDIEASLSLETLQGLENNAEFMGNITTAKKSSAAALNSS